MADISKITVNSTTYNLKDSRIPALNNSTAQFLRGDGTWATPTVQTMSGNVDVSDDDTGMVIEPSSGGGGTYQAKTNITPTTSSQTITPDAGYDALSSVQIDAMPSGTAGTPTATKGSVSNHSVSVTPSVTNTTGYITGSTKTGTAVTVSASELVSGSETKTANGTFDVTNLAELIVNVPTAKTATGTFTGNGTRQVTISCNFEPDLVYWWTDAGTSAYSGTVSGLIARDMLAVNVYSNNSTTRSSKIELEITDMNTGGSSYNFQATYSNNTVTLYCFSNNARSLFKNGQSYKYQLVKWTA